MDPVFEIPFDQYQRYSFIQRVIETVDPHRTKLILEVGGAFSPLRQMIPRHRLVVSDYREDTGNVQIRADAFHMPFEDGCFDLVISTDVLEHVPSENRNSFVDEMIRVGSTMLLIGFPSGALSEKVDSTLATYLHDTLNFDHSFLQEHVINGLPDVSEIHNRLKFRGAGVYEFDNANLFSWLTLMKSSFALQQHLEFDTARLVMNKIFNENYNWTSHDPPVYRKFLLAFKEPIEEGLRRQIEGLQNPPEYHSIHYAEATLQLASCFIQILETLKRNSEQEIVHHRSLTAESIQQRRSMQLTLDETIQAMNSSEEQLKETIQQLIEKRQELNDTNKQLIEKQLEVKQLMDQNDLNLKEMHAQSLQIKNLQDYLNLFLSHPVYKVYDFIKKCFQ